MMKIDKGVPFPTPRKTDVTETLRALQVGDSFVLDRRDASYRGSLTTQAKRVGIKVATRAEGDKSLRVWRVE